MNRKILKGIKTLAVASLVFTTGALAVDIQVDDGTVLLAEDIQEIMIDANADLVKITTTAGDWNLVQDDPDPGTPTPQVSLTVNGGSSATVDEGTTVSLAWTISDAVSCTTENGNTQWDSLGVTLTGGGDTGSQTNTVDFVGSRSYTLRCVNGANTTTRSVSVTGESIDPPDPVGMCPEDFDASLSGDDYEWADVFSTIWPRPTYSQKTLTIRRGGYLSIAFDTGSNEGWRGSYKSITSISTAGRRLLSISACPGDFSEYLPENDVTDCTEDQYNGGAVAWTTEAAGRSGFCKLETDSTYFLNMTFVEGGETGGNDRCSGDSCRTVLQVYATD